MNILVYFALLLFLWCNVLNPELLGTQGLNVLKGEDLKEVLVNVRVEANNLTSSFGIVQ